MGELLQLKVISYLKPDGFRGDYPKWLVVHCSGKVTDYDNVELEYKVLPDGLEDWTGAEWEICEASMKRLRAEMSKAVEKAQH
jgi:hypothetical protein